MTSEPKANLWISVDDISRLALSIPLAECSNYAVNPLKWLRFLGYTILGCEGYLSTSETGPEIRNYTAGIEARSYYYISDNEPCLIDVDVADDRTSTTFLLTERRADFERRVIERDGNCIITGDTPLTCRACHIIPHSKGDNYIKNAFKYRHGTDNPIFDINDIQNGLLLNAAIHPAIRLAFSAFLRTPNFAMTVNDVPYLQQEQINDLPYLQRGQINEQGPSSRFTLHHLVSSPDLIGKTILKYMPNNSDARQPLDTTEWPSATIVDLFYGSAALKAWGSKEFIEFVREESRYGYYDLPDILGGAEEGPDDMAGGGPDNCGSQICHQMAFVLSMTQ